MRYLLDTCIMLYMLNKTGEMNNDVESIVFDYGNRLYICAASVRELVAAWHKYQHTDTTDHLIIAHAITEHLPLISSDGKFDFYCNQGLDFIFNKK